MKTWERFILVGLFIFVHISAFIVLEIFIFEKRRKDDKLLKIHEEKVKKLLANVNPTLSFATVATVAVATVKLARRRSADRSVDSHDGGGGEQLTVGDTSNDVNQRAHYLWVKGFQAAREQANETIMQHRCILNPKLEESSERVLQLETLQESSSMTTRRSNRRQREVDTVVSSKKSRRRLN